MRRAAALALVLAAIVACGQMTVSQRLLMAVGGTSPFAPPPVNTTPPFDASWVRSASNPILSPTVAWEETAMQEPDVLYVGGTWKMWYTGGWTHPGMGYATSSDGITWTKYASNPVYGQGGSGYANTADCPEVLLVGSTYWLFSSGGVDTTHPFTTFRVATSSDGIAWTTQASSITLPSGTTMWGNRVVWQEGGTWKMLQDAGPSPWQVYLYTSSDGLTWTLGNGGGALSTLQVAAGGMYGGPYFATDAAGNKTPKFGGLYHLWYHAAPVSGVLPTNIYHATSPDLITWTQTSPSPVLTHSGTGFEVDQVADPDVVVVGGTAYLFYDAVDNTTTIARVMLATAPATP